MKIELNTLEATDLFTQLAQVSKVTELEAELATVRIDLENSDRSRRDVWARNERLESEIYDLRHAADEARREVSALRSEVLKLQDQLIPFRKERALTNVFSLFTTGQKIYAINALRELYGLGLKEAKDIVDGLAPNAVTMVPHLFREMSELALIFRELGKTPVDVQRERLRPFVFGGEDDIKGDSDSNRRIESILNGTFKVETP